MVYFSQSDIAKMKAAHDEALRQKAEARAAAEREQTMREFNDISVGEDDVDDAGIDDFLDEEEDDFGNEEDFGNEDDFGSEEDFEEE